MPPPTYVYQIQHDHHASLFFFTVLFGLAGDSASTASAGFLLAAERFNFALIAFLFLELPKEPIAIFPFFDFLSPFPIFKKLYGAMIAKEKRISKE
jgi:hypothetical protein